MNAETVSFLTAEGVRAVSASNLSEAVRCLTARVVSYLTLEAVGHPHQKMLSYP